MNTLLDSMRTLVAVRIAELLRKDIIESGTTGITATLNDDLMSVTVQVEDTTTLNVTIDAKVNK